MSAWGYIRTYADSSTWLLACPAAAAVLSALRTFVNWFRQQRQSKEQELTWKRLGGGSWVASACSHPRHVVLSLGFLILSPGGGREMRSCLRPLLFFLISGKTPSVGNATRRVHVCTHPIVRTQEHDANTHIYFWSRDAVSWLSESKVSSFQLPSPPRSWFFNLQLSHILKKDLVL